MLLRMLLPLCCAGAVLGGVATRAGWLDRAVDYHRRLFVDDVLRVAPIEIKASLQRLPAGYTDAPRWEYGSVARLLALLGATESAAPLRRALRRALHLSPPTRRFYSKQQSWKLFPSLGKEHPNEIYYDFGSGSREGAPEYVDSWKGSDEVVLLQNPVEARLPGAHISIKLLREILEARALAGRKMPDTTSSTIAWITKNTTSAVAETGNVTNAEQSEGTYTNADADVTTLAVTVGDDATDAGGDVTTTPGVGDVPETATTASENSVRAFLSASSKWPLFFDHMENSQL